MKRDLIAVIITNFMFSFVYFLPLVVLPLYVKRLGARGRTSIYLLTKK